MSGWKIDIKSQSQYEEAMGDYDDFEEYSDDYDEDFEEEFTEETEGVKETEEADKAGVTEDPEVTEVEEE